MSYDFAGANTYFPHIQTFFNGMINGGFSLRKKTAMIECCQKINCDVINNYISNMKNMLSINCDFPSQAVENGSSPPLRSGEALNSSE